MGSRFKAIFIVGFLCVFSLILGVSSFGATEIDSCQNIVVSGDYVLNQTLSSVGNCLNISASNVFIDFAGFTVTASSCAKVVNITSADNVTLVNGFINNTRSGSCSGALSNLFMSRITNILIANMTINDSTSDTYSGNPMFYSEYFENVSFVNSTINNGGVWDYGMYLIHGRNLTFSHNRLFDDSFGYGNWGTSFWIVHVNDSIVSNNTYSRPSGFGAFAFTSVNRINFNNNTIIGRMANQAAFSLIVTTSSNNNFTNNYFTTPIFVRSLGMQLINSTNNLIENSTFSGWAYDKAIQISNSNLTTIRNVTINVTYSGAYGISLDSGSNQNNITHSNIITNSVVDTYPIIIANANNNSFSNINITSLNNNAISIGGTSTSINNSFTAVSINGKSINYRYNLANQIITDSASVVGQDICAACSNVNYTGTFANTSAIYIGASTNTNVLDASSANISIALSYSSSSSINRVNITWGDVSLNYANYTNVTYFRLLNGTYSDIGSNNSYISNSFFNDTRYDSVNAVTISLTTDAVIQNSTFDRVGGSGGYCMLLGGTNTIFRLNNQSSNRYGSSFMYMEGSLTIHNNTFTAAQHDGNMFWMKLDSMIFVNNTVFSNGHRAFYVDYGSNTLKTIAHNTFIDSAVNPGNSLIYFSGAMGNMAIENNTLLINRAALYISTFAYNFGTFKNNTIISNYTGNIFTVYGPSIQIINNSITSISNAAYLLYSTVNDGTFRFFGNNITGNYSAWVYNTHINNSFNTTVNGVAQGNYWPMYGNSSYTIYDTNYDGWGDGYGAQEPINATTWSTKWIGNGSDYAPATTTFGCGVLNNSNFVYNLTTNISSYNTCFTINAANITLDGNGYTMFYGTSGSGIGRGIDIYANNFTLRNIAIVNGSSGGIGSVDYALYSNAGVRYGLIDNVTIDSVPNELARLQGDDYTIKNSRFTHAGQFRLFGNRFLFTNNTVTCPYYATACIELFGASFSNLTNNTFNSSSLASLISIRSATFNNIISNNILTAPFQASTGIDYYYGGCDTGYNHIISNNVFLVNGITAKICGANNLTFTNNSVTSASAYPAISGYFLTNSSISNSTIITSGNYSYGILLNRSADNAIYTTNIVTSGNYSHGVYVFNSSNLTLSGSNVSVSGLGASAVESPASGFSAYSPYLQIRNSVINSSKYITVNVDNYGGDYLTLFNNTIYGKVSCVGWQVIHVYNRANAVIANNNITSYCNDPTIYLRANSNNALVENNTINVLGASGYGIWAQELIHDAIIRNNTFYINGTDAFGIVIAYFSFSNNVTQNTFYISGSGSTAYEILGTSGSGAGNLFARNNISLSAANTNAIRITEHTFPAIVHSNVITTSVATKAINVTKYNVTYLFQHISPNNTINGVNVSYAVNVSNLTITGDYTQNNKEDIICVYCSNVTFTRFNTIGNVTFILSNSTTLQDSTISRNNSGAVISLIGTRNATIQRNNITGVNVTSGINFLYETTTSTLVYDTRILSNRINISDITWSSVPLFVTSSSGAIIDNNSITSLGSILAAIHIFNNGYPTVISNNNISAVNMAIRTTQTSAANIFANNTISASGSGYAGIGIENSGNVQTIYNNTISSSNGARGITIQGQVLINASRITTTGGGAGIYFNPHTAGVGASQVWHTIINASGASTTSLPASVLTNSSDVLTLYNTTFSNITFGGVTQASVAVYNYLQLNVSRLGTTPIATTLNVYDENINVANISSNSTGLSPHTLLQQQTLYSQINFADVYLPFTTNLNDTSAYNHYTTGNPTINASGFRGSAADFNGVDTSILVNSSLLQVPQSISFWAYPRVLGTTVVSDDDGSFGNSVQISSAGANVGYVGGAALAFTGASISTNSWTQWTIIWEATNISLYINGTLIGTQSYTPGSTSDDNQFSIGLHEYNNNYFSGLLDEVYVFNRALTSYEVQNLYNISNAQIVHGTTLAIYNGTSSNYISSSVLFNGTTLANVTAENPTADVVFTHLDDSIANYNYNQYYYYPKQINFTVENASINNVSIFVREVLAQNQLNSYSITNDCPAVAFGNNCTMLLNLTINPGSSLSSRFEYRINYTNRDGSVVSTAFNDTMTILDYAQVTFNQTSINYTGLLNETQTVDIEVLNTGSVSTGNMVLSATNGSSFFSYKDNDYDPITQINELSSGASTILRILLSVSNYTAANYSGVIRLTSSKLVQDIPFILNVTSNLTIPDVSPTYQHNLSYNYSLIINNTGNVPLQTLAVSYVEGTLPASWISNLGSVSSLLQPWQNVTKNITFTIPSQQDPGTYTGTLYFNATNGLNQSLPVSVTVPVNRSFALSPSIQSVAFNITSSIASTEYLLPNITIINTGNVILNFTIGSEVNVSGYPYFYSQGRFDTIPKINPIGINLTKTETAQMEFKLKSYDKSDLLQALFSTGMGLGINLSLVNATNADNASKLSVYVVTISDQPPTADTWRIGSTAISNGTSLEINQRYNISVLARDDGDSLNLTAGYFTVYNGVNATNYTYNTVINKRFSFNYTPTVNGTHNITFFIAENSSAGSKEGNGSVSFFISTRPSSVSITSNSNTVTTALSNQTDDVTISIPATLRVNGNVSVYNTSIFISSIYGWSASSIDYGNVTQNNTNLDITANVVVPKGTAFGNYSTNISFNYTNPDLTTATRTSQFTVQVMPNADFEVAMNDTIYQQHGADTYYSGLMTVVPKGNSNTTFTVNTSNITYAVQFAKGGSYSSTTTGNNLNLTANTSINVRLTIPSYSSSNSTFSINVTNALGRSVVVPITVVIPANATMSATPSLVNKSVVAGDTFTNENLVNITNTGNTVLTLGLNLNGTISSLLSPVFAPTISITPGSTQQVLFNYTFPPTGNTYTGTFFANASETLNISVPMTFSSYQFELSAFNFTGTTGVHTGDTITFDSSLTDSAVPVSTNVTFIPRIGGVACSGVSTQQITVSGNPAFRTSCTVPAKADGLAYTFTLQAIYDAGSRGNVTISSIDTTDIAYADITSPYLTGNSITDFPASTATTIEFYGVDNGLGITDSNSDANLYEVSLAATRSSTGATQTDTLSRFSGSDGVFRGSVTYSLPGAYTYVATITDPAGNANSSYTGTFNVYQYKNYTKSLNYTNDSGSTVGVYANITLYNSLNSTNVTVTNGTFNATLKTDTYTINITDRTSTLSLTTVSLLDLPTTDIFSYGQLKSDEYRVLSQGLFSDLQVSNIFNGMFFRINESTNFKVYYNYSTYGVSNENGIRAYACYNYTLNSDPITACTGGFVPLTRTSLSTSNDFVLFDSPIANTENQTVAIIFFSYVLSGQPAATFAGPNISASMNHNSTTSVSFSITSVANGGTLTGISFACINTSAVSDVCKNFTVSSFSMTSLTQNQLQPFIVTIAAPLGLTAGSYSGTMRYQSNLNSSTPLLYDVPIYVTVLSSSGYSYTNLGTTNATVGASTQVTLDTYTFTNTGNSIVPLTFSSNGTLLSDSSLNVYPNQQEQYALKLRVPNTIGTYRYGFTFGSTTINYTLNVSQQLNITAVSPATDIVAGNKINVSFDLYENGVANGNILQYNTNSYFSAHSIQIDNITCAQNNDENIYDNFNSDQLTCTAPTQINDKNSYTLTLNMTRNGIVTTKDYTVMYRDTLAPSLANTTRLTEFQNISQINFTLSDRSNVSSTMSAVVRNSAGVIVTTYNGFTNYNSSNLSAVGLYNTSENDFTFRHNYSSADDFTANISYCDMVSNCKTYLYNISHYPLVPYTPTQSVGQNSSIFSAAVQTSSGQWSVTPPVFSVSFRRPNLNEEIASGITDSSTGIINISNLQNRTYDIVANSTNLDVTFSNMSYNGSQIIALEQIGVSGITNGKLGFNFEPQTNFTSALLTYRTASGGDLAAGTFIVCTQWNFAANTCTGTQSTVYPLNYTTSGSQFVYTLNVTHFSAYILVVPPITTTTSSTTSSTSSSSGGGGGGGGGASISAIASLLNSTVNNLSKISQSYRDEVRADTTRIEQNLYPLETARVNVNLVNTGNDSRKVTIEISPELKNILTVEPQEFEIPISGSKTISVLMTAPDAISQTVFDGFIRINYVNEIISIPVKIRLLEAPRQPPSIAMNIVTPTLTLSGTLRFQISVSYPYVREVPATLTYTIYKSDTDQLVYSDSRELNLSKSTSFAEALPLENRYATGNYYIRANLLFTDSNNLLVPLIDSKPFTITEFFFFIEIFHVGNTVILVWHILLLMFVVLSGVSTYSYIKKKLDARKRYHLPVDANLLPQPGSGAGYMGYLAETNQRAFVDFESLKMHTLVAGSTGGGKSFAAQVLVEEALKKNVAVVVFDPTAQWSGFLRKNTNEALIKLYSKFRMNPQTDAMAFKGNIRRVENYLEVIELKEYLKPGEITIFDCHKMTFEQIDLFVANTVSQVFMAELEESRDLKLLMVYDEVHRLLPKFGGSGAGFMQVERACREFRKWGIGVLLISQVLSDFIGQIKANINTEIQMRTRDEEDLKRLSLKYGDDLLHAVVKAEVGTGMVQNSKYNKGRPWLVSFRPVQHAVERLTEKELRDYDIYNPQLEDLADSLKQLEAGFKVDVMDMRIELDLAYDKLKEGKFDVVQIYVEELKQKVDAQWTKFKKKPTKRVKKLLDKKTMDKFLELAKKQHYEAASAQAMESAQQPAQYQSPMSTTPNVSSTTGSTGTKGGQNSGSSQNKKDKSDEKKEKEVAPKSKQEQSVPTKDKAVASSNSSSAKDKLSKLRSTLGKK